jgi:hypothetical protein
MPIRTVCALVLAVAAAPMYAYADEEPVGSIRTIEGDVLIVRGDEEIAAAKGTRIFAHDVIRTKSKSAAGIVLRDDTTVSLGPKSELEMKQFTFEPDEGLFGMVVKMVKGTFIYVSGRIAKLAPDSVKVETPEGVIAVRGTRFMAKISG